MKSVSSPTRMTTESSAASLTSQIYERLRNDILSGALAPGKKLPIEEIKDAYGIGASAIREALSLLTSDALVERIDHRGFRVAPVSRAGFEELLRTRFWLEERALRESMRAGDVGWEEAVVLANFHLSRARHAQSVDRLLSSDEWETRHRTLHQAFLAACPSKLLLRFCDQMYDLNIRYRRVSGPDVDKARNVDAEHAAIVEAVLARDEDRSVDLLFAHYTRTADFVRDRLS
jgi:GntR family transcriptional regulator, carbon starvation induced regulator